ncbi:CLUMA_CG000795, isoform A [Clunio marinus]|uniref:Palmitoyltransferase n=1 Tax=Clunio marinus TaxID=568069 RepID=A0A1J1HKJ1_9DIPT|nr:CLUMA_CG000795, isoform A [Clunio marinus]
MEKTKIQLDRNNGVSIIRRFLHPGPLLTIFIIKSITIQTLYLNSMWWPPHRSFAAFLNQIIFIVLSALTAFNFVMAAVLGPSYLPFGWKPKNKKHESYLQLCSVCPGTFKAPRAHHCRKCDRCVAKMDHHCVYLNNCVGHGNHSHFVWFLSLAVVGCTHAAIILICSLYAGLYRDYYVYYQEFSKATVRLTTWSLVLTVFNIGLAVGVIIAVGMLLFFQMKSIIRNKTGIEDWIVDKAIYRRKAMMRAAEEVGEKDFKIDPFVYPYDLGIWKNVAQVVNFSCLPIGDGVIWPVVDGCDQFTLTREQLEQKKEKRARTRRYRIVAKVSGSWMPLWSQGCKVCVNPPLTDEPRIALEVDDLVNVTRWRKHWLFGEKVQDFPEIQSTMNGKQQNEILKQQIAKRRSRGWFPRQCAVEFFEDNDEESENEVGNNNEDMKKKN